MIGRLARRNSSFLLCVIRDLRQAFEMRIANHEFRIVKQHRLHALASGLLMTASIQTQVASSFMPRAWALPARLLKWKAALERLAHFFQKENLELARQRDGWHFHALLIDADSVNILGRKAPYCSARTASSASSMRSTA